MIGVPPREIKNLHNLLVSRATIVTTGAPIWAVAEAELLSESKELNVNFQDLESFLADPDPHDLMRIRPRHPNGHFGACIRLVYVPPVYVSGHR